MRNIKKKGEFGCDRCDRARIGTRVNTRVKYTEEMDDEDVRDDARDDDVYMEEDEGEDGGMCDDV